MKRVVTGHEESGKSVFVSVGQPPRTVTLDHMPGLEFVELWSSKTPAVVPASREDPTLHMSSFVPAPGETQFRIFTLGPDAQLQVAMSGGFDQEAVQAEILNKLPGLAETVEADFRMHTTDTVDYAIVLSGEVWLELDDGKEVHLHQDDCVIQNGTRHAWSNRSTEPCVMAAIMVGAKRMTS